MFIVQKKQWKFLLERDDWALFMIKIPETWINEQLLINFTNKVCEKTFNNKKYKEFESKIYNKDSLKKVIFKSKFILFNISILNLINKDSYLYKQWKIFQNWYQNEFPIKFIHNSNNIEGSKIPEEEVDKIIKNKKYIYKIKNEIQEVKNSKNAWNFLNEKFIFNETYIKKVYHILTKSLLQENGNKYPRGFKKVANIANNNITTSPENVKKEVNLLLKTYKDNKKTVFILKNAFDFHLTYEQIHPFENWNWRTGRFFMNKVLLKNKMLPMIVFKDNFRSYFNAIDSCNTWKKNKYYSFMVEQYSKTLDLIY